LARRDGPHSKGLCGPFLARRDGPPSKGLCGPYVARLAAEQTSPLDVLPNSITVFKVGNIHIKLF